MLPKRLASGVLFVRSKDRCPPVTEAPAGEEDGEVLITVRIGVPEAAAVEHLRAV